jgi:hypothetical protein
MLEGEDASGNNGLVHLCGTAGSRLRMSIEEGGERLHGGRRRRLFGRRERRWWRGCAGSDSMSVPLCCRVCVGGDEKAHCLQGVAVIVRCDEGGQLPLSTVGCALHGLSNGVEDGRRELVAKGGEDGSMLRLCEIAAKQGSDIVVSVLYSGGGGSARGEEGGSAIEQCHPVPSRARVRSERRDGGMRRRGRGRG